MKIVVDSSAWIEWFIASPTSDKLAPHWPTREQTLVPTLVQLEIAKWLKREISEEAMDNALAYVERCVVIPLDTRIALLAADICAAHKLSTADAIVYATALENNAQLLTCDAHFKGLDGGVCGEGLMVEGNFYAKHPAPHPEEPHLRRLEGRTVFVELFLRDLMLASAWCVLRDAPFGGSSA